MTACLAGLPAPDLVPLRRHVTGCGLRARPLRPSVASLGPVVRYNSAEASGGDGLAAEPADAARIAEPVTSPPIPQTP